MTYRRFTEVSLAYVFGTIIRRFCTIWRCAILKGNLCRWDVWLLCILVVNWR